MRKEIKKHKGYFVSDDGKVFKDDLELVQHTNAAGHKYVWLGDKIHTVCYLVASAFVDNTDNCFLVGYKDGNKDNIKADNLYWYYQGEVEEDGKGNTTPLYKCDLDGNIIAEYPRILNAANENNISYYRIQAKTQDADIAVVDNMVFVPTIYYNRYTIKQKIAAAPKQKNTINKKKAAYQVKTIIVNLDGEILGRFDCIREAAEKLNTASNIVGQKLSKNKYYINKDNKIIVREKDYSPSLLQAVKEKIKDDCEYKKVLQINLQGDIIREFTNVVKAAEELNIKVSSIYSQFKYKGFYHHDDIIIVKGIDYTAELLKKIQHKLKPKPKQTEQPKQRQYEIVVRLNLNGEVIETYNGLNDAARSNNINYYTLFRRIQKYHYFQKDNLILVKENDYTAVMDKIQSELAKPKPIKQPKQTKPKRQPQPKKPKLSDKKKVYQINNDGEIIREFPKLRQAAEAFNKDYAMIYMQIVRKDYYIKDGVVLVFNGDWEDEEKRNKIMKRINR